MVASAVLLEPILIRTLDLSSTLDLYEENVNFSRHCNGRLDVTKTDKVGHESPKMVIIV